MLTETRIVIRIGDERDVKLLGQFGWECSILRCGGGPGARGMWDACSHRTFQDVHNLSIKGWAWEGWVGNDCNPGMITRGWEANGISYSVLRQGLQAGWWAGSGGERRPLGLRPWGDGEAQPPTPHPSLPPRVGCTGGSKSFSAEAQAVDSRHPGSFPPAWKPNPFPPAQPGGRDLGWGGACSAQPHIWLRSSSPHQPLLL